MEIFDEEFMAMTRETYTSRLIEALQDKTKVITQFMSPLEGCSGRYHEYNGIGSTELEPRTQRLQKKVREEAAFNRRRVMPVFLGKAMVLSADEQKVKGAFAATASDYVQMLVNAVGRAQDALALGVVYDKAKRNYVIAETDTQYQDAVDGSLYKGGTTGGIMGANYIGENGTTKEILPLQPTIFGADGSELATAYTGYTGANLDFRETNIIPVNYVDSGSPVDTALTLDKLMALRLAFEERHAVEPGEEICMSITPRQKMALMKEDKLQNGDFGFQVLKDGFINEFLGIRLLVTPKVPVVNIGTAADPKWVRACPAWLKHETKWGVWDEAKFDVIKLDQEYYDAIEVSTQCAYGAGRMRKETVITTLCHEGLAF